MNKRDNRKVVFTNGTFQLIHEGHIDLFRQIRYLYPSDNFKLIVGINSDDSIKRIKNRDVAIPHFSRKRILESIKYIDEVEIFEEDTPYQLIERIKPLILVKGPDYKGKEVIGSDLVGYVTIICHSVYNVSTTKIYKKIKKIDV